MQFEITDDDKADCIVPSISPTIGACAVQQGAALRRNVLQRKSFDKSSPRPLQEANTLGHARRLGDRGGGS